MRKASFDLTSGPAAEGLPFRTQPGDGTTAQSGHQPDRPTRSRSATRRALTLQNAVSDRHGNVIVTVAERRLCAQ
jgi:hypothetical protein